MSITNITTNDSSLSQYLTSTGELPADVLLGRIVLYTITDEPVSHSDIQAWFRELGLDEALMPFPIKEIDAFKKATASLDGHRYGIDGGKMAHMLCRDVTSTPDYVRRQLTREVQDQKKKRLYYDQAIEATFYRKTSAQGSPAIQLTINRDGVLAEEVSKLQAVNEAITAAYHRYSQFHDGQKLRTLVRSYLRHLNAIEIKGGVYFIHASKDSELSALSGLVNRFGGGCAMNTIPIVDLLEQRQFIAGVFEREASQALQEIARDVKAAIESPSVTGSAVAKLRERYDEVLSNAEEHMLNLQVTQDLTAASAEVALRELTRLQERMMA